jgi:hypothetical protein
MSTPFGVHQHAAVKVWNNGFGLMRCDQVMAAEQIGFRTQGMPSVRAIEGRQQVRIELR